MRGAVAGAVVLALACYALPAGAQLPGTTPNPAAARDDASKVGIRNVTGSVKTNVTGSVKTVTDKGLVVVGHEQGQKDREWAFAFDGDTRIEAGGKPRPATELRKGDAVTVSYMDRDGKIVAQNVKVNAR